MSNFTSNYEQERVLKSRCRHAIYGKTAEDSICDIVFLGMLSMPMIGEFSTIGIMACADCNYNVLLVFESYCLVLRKMPITSIWYSKNIFLLLLQFSFRSVSCDLNFYDIERFDRGYLYGIY